MRKRTKVILAGILILAASGFVGAMTVRYNNALVNETGLTFNKNVVLPLNNSQIDYLSFVTLASSVTFPTDTFTDGSRSTGAFTVSGGFALLSTASASDYMTVVSTTLIPLGGIITINGVTLQNGIQWFSGPTSSETANSIMITINQDVPGIIASTGGSVGQIVFTTATTPGYAGNSMTYAINFTTNAISFNTYTSSSANAATSQFSGGKDATFVTVNGIAFRAGYDFSIGATPAQTAGNLTTAIVAASSVTGVSASNVTSLVKTTATTVGLNPYVLTSSSNTLLSISAGGNLVISSGASTAQMWGGVNPSWSFTGVSTTTTLINIANHGYTTGLQILYSGTPAIGGLTTGTTYFAIPFSPNTVALAVTSTGAQAGNAIVITSTANPFTADTYTLAPLAITGTPSYKWQVSNDGLTWADYTANDQGVANIAVSLGVYNSTGTVNAWDFGEVQYAFIRLAIVSPTAGAIKIQAWGNGKNTAY